MLPDINEDRGMPTRRVLDMQRDGFSERDISARLEQEKFDKNEINSAIDQATVKNEIAPFRSQSNPPILNPDEVPAPSTSSEEPPIQESFTSPEISPLTTSIQPSSPSFAPEPVGRANYEAIEEIAESVITEKWEDMLKNVGDLKLWKERVETDLSGIKQEILRVESRFENLQKAILSKLGEYSEGVTDLGAEMRAMEKIFEKILTPLTRSVKDLEKVTEKIKK